MTLDWDEITEALESSDADRVNAVLDELGDLDHAERAEVFDEGFDDLAAIYAGSDDGYVRQSTVRVAQEFLPGAVTEFLIHDDPEAERWLPEQVDTLCGFLLKTLEDEDGRVRRATIRALKDVYRSYDALGDDETIEALISELEAMAEDLPENQEKHALETKEDAEFFLQSVGTRLVSGLERLQERSKDT